MSRLVCAVLLLALAAPSLVAAASLKDLAWLEGEWRGQGLVGEERNVIHKRFALEMGGAYLVERTESMFPPAEPSTEFEIHEDAAWYYAADGELRVKAFYIEGFVLSGTVKVSEDGRTVTVASTSVEGGPPGMRSRLTYVLGEDGRLTGSFDVDWSGGGEWSCMQSYAFERLGGPQR